MFLRKRNNLESQLLTACLKWLQCEENIGRIKWVDRLNSGRNKGIRLCRAGTPDAYIILNDGRVVWVETKSGKNNLNENQIFFRNKVKDLETHHYLIIRDIRELIDGLDRICRNGFR